MSNSEILEEVRQSGGLEASMNNSIISPIQPSNADDFQLVFNSFGPNQIMYYSYGLTVTVQVQFDSKAPLLISLTPGRWKTVPTPPGTKAINASISGVPSLTPGKSKYALVVTF